MGEGGAISPPAAIASAVRDALQPLDLRLVRLPLTPERVLEAIAAARDAAGQQAEAATDASEAGAAMERASSHPAVQDPPTVPLDSV